MSSKPTKKKAEAPASKPASVRPSGKAPLAMVETRHGTEMMSRMGRGFSLGELSGAGLSPNLASGWGARTDSRRRSVLQANTDALKAWGAKAAASKKQPGAVKKAEKEIEKVAGEVEEEVKAVEEEVQKAGKKVKKEAKKAEKAVKAKAEKKPKPKKKAGS